MICPNLSNPQIRQEFEELKNQFGEPMAYLLWDRNGGYHLDKAPNGESSKLFNDLLDFTKDRQLTLATKAKTLSNKFKDWFGNSQVVDKNGEPLIQNNSVISENNQTKSIFNSGEYNRNSDNIYDNEVTVSQENRRQTDINGSMSNQIISNFEAYFPDYVFYNDRQRELVANLVERGQLQITCSI